MIIEKQTEANIEKEGDSQESIGMSLDLDSAQILMQMLSKNLYSDAIGSTVRECASNALDSHRRVGVTDPIIVSFKSVNNQYEFSVEDFGIGLDADDVKNIISKYGKSTKRLSNNELGMMGLGFKAPLAYSSSFYFVCRKDGIERKYMMYEGEDTNTIDLLYEKPTTERNGVKVIVPVKYSDRGEFNVKIGEQLCYFKDVYFDVPGMDNNFFIFRTEHFQFSQLCPDSKLHICLDDVYYPLDFDKLGVNRLHFPVGLRFGLSDGIFPTPNREAIRYTKEAKEAILNKITTIADHFVEKYNESVQETEDLVAVMNTFDYSARYVNIDSARFDVSEISKFASIPVNLPKLKGVNKLSIDLVYRTKHMLLSEYENKYIIDGKKMRKTDRSWQKTINYKEVLDNKGRIYYSYKDKVGGNMRDYLKSIHPMKNVHLIKRVNHIPLRTGSESYYSFLGLRNHPKSEWRNIIKEWQFVQSYITRNINDLDKVVIPTSFLDRKKKARVTVSNGVPGSRKVKLQGEIVCKIAHDLERYVDGQNCKFVSTTFKMNEIHRMKALVVYGKESDRKQMDEFYKPFKNWVKFAIFSDREFANMEKVKIHNWMYMEEFIKGDNKPFRRIATARLIEVLKENNESAFSTYGNILKSISSSLYAKIEMLDEYERKNRKYGDDSVFDAIVKIAEPNMLFDMEIYPVYKEVKNVLDKLPFIDTVCHAGNGGRNNGEKWTLVMRDLFKYHKTRMDWKNYNITLNEDVINPITEETINQSL